MARSDKVSFRREFTLTSSGYAGDDSGFYVGDIMSLHIDSDGDKVSYQVEGRTHSSGPWNQIKNTRDTLGEDVRAWEYVRINVTVPTYLSSAKIILFGYELPVDKAIQVVASEENELRLKIQSTDRLDGIYEELLKLNQYMEIITGDKI